MPSPTHLLGLRSARHENEILIEHEFPSSGIHNVSVDFFVEKKLMKITRAGHRMIAGDWNLTLQFSGNRPV